MSSLKSILFKRVVIILIALFFGFMLGTIYKTPNYFIILESKRQDTEWESEKMIEFYRSTTPFFSFESFKFNLSIGVITFLVVLLIGCFMADDSFRDFLYKKIFFTEERSRYKRKNNE